MLSYEPEMNKNKRRLIGSILTTIGFLSTLLALPNYEALLITVPIWVLGIMIYGMEWIEKYGKKDSVYTSKAKEEKGSVGPMQ